MPEWKSHHILQAIVEGSTNAVYVKDTLGRYQLFNHAAELFTGKSAAQVMGKDDRFLYRLMKPRQSWKLTPG